MAEVVVPTQVFEQLIVVQVTVVTELAEWMSSVTRVIWVSVRSVTCQFLTIIPLPLVGEDLVEVVRFSTHSTQHNRQLLMMILNLQN